MERKELEIFSEASNAAIVRMPGRKFPRVVVQGDTLCNWLTAARSFKSRVAELNDQELTCDAEEFLTTLTAYLRHYESVLAAHNIELPYIHPET
jgi:hypothetical protein